MPHLHSQSKSSRQAEDLLSLEAQWAIKEKFGSNWRQAWVAWQLPSGTWKVTQIKHLTENSQLPENSGDMFCFAKLGRPTDSEIASMMARESVRPVPTINDAQKKALLEKHPGLRTIELKVRP